MFTYLKLKKNGGKSNFELVPAMHVFCILNDYYIATVYFPLLDIHLKALIELCDKSVPDFSVLIFLCKHCQVWLFEEVILGF